MVDMCFFLVSFVASKERDGVVRYFVVAAAAAYLCWHKYISH